MLTDPLPWLVAGACAATIVLGLMLANPVAEELRAMKREAEARRKVAALWPERLHGDQPFVPREARIFHDGGSKS